jgi:hypothetical protein
MRNFESQAGAFFNCLYCKRKMRRKKAGRIRKPFCCDEHEAAYADKLRVHQRLERLDERDSEGNPFSDS